MNPDRPPRNMILQGLRPQELERFLASATPVSLDFKRVLHQRNEAIDTVYFINTGVVSLLADLGPDSTVEVATAGYEGFVGLPIFFGVPTMPLTALVQIVGDGLAVPSAALVELAMVGTDLHARIQRYAQALFVQLSQGVVCNRTHSSTQRGARWLLMTHDRVSSDSFPLTHEFLSQMLGVRRATVTEVANQLQLAGRITYSRGVVTILDRPALESDACVCYAILRDEYRRLVGPYPRAN